MICEVGQAEVLEDRRRDLDAALAVLADAGLRARARQQHADLEGAALRPHDGGRGEQGGGRGSAGQQAAAAERQMNVGS